MQFFVPIPLPLAIVGGLLIGMARGMIWLARSIAWPVLRWGWQSYAEAWQQARESVAQYRRAREFVRRVDAVEKQVNEYCAERAAGRTIDGECRRLEDKT